MKKCVRCGKMVEDNVLSCECGFNFKEYEEVNKVFFQTEDPSVSKDLKTNLLDNPFLCFIFGILSVFASILFLFESSINILFLLLVIAFSFLTFFFYTKPSKASLIPVKKFGNWLANIAVFITIFKIVYILFGQLIK